MDNVTGRLAPDHVIRHAVVLGLLGVLASAAGAAATWDGGARFGPRWYSLAVIAIALPCSWLGGRLVRKHAPST